MAECIPFLRVRNIFETIQWYERIGFKCTATNHVWEPDCELNWAQLKFEGAEFMIGPDERKNNSGEKDASLYFRMETIDGIANKIKKEKIAADVDEQTFYGRKEISFEDINGFHITFSCETGSK
jgi:uncharacterized glyoxalase superfamily protein PhnB